MCLLLGVVVSPGSKWRRRRNYLKVKRGINLEIAVGSVSEYSETRHNCLKYSIAFLSRFVKDEAVASLAGFGAAQLADSVDLNRSALFVMA